MILFAGIETSTGKHSKEGTECHGVKISTPYSYFGNPWLEYLVWFTFTRRVVNPIAY